MMVAVNSEVALISGATQLLVDKGWPDYLVIYNKKFYLQSQEYTDAHPGIDWYIVVIVPAPFYADSLQKHSVYFTAVVAISLVTIVSTAAGAVTTIFLFNRKLFKLTRPVLTLMVITGILLLAVYCSFLLGNNNDLNCQIRPWMFNLAFTLAFSPLLIKAFMVHRLFNLNPLAKNKMIKTKTLFVYTALFLSVDVILIAISAYGAGAGTKEESIIETINGAQTEVTYCSTTRNKGFLLAEIIYKGFMIGAACVLSFLVRRVNGLIAGAKTLLIIVYNVAFCSGFVLLIIHNVTDIGLSVTVQVVGICFCCLLTLGLLLVPPLYMMVTMGDKAAAEAVLNELMKPADKNGNHRHEGKADGEEQDRAGSTNSHQFHNKSSEAISSEGFSIISFTFRLFNPNPTKSKSAVHPVGSTQPGAEGKQLPANEPHKVGTNNDVHPSHVSGNSAVHVSGLGGPAVSSSSVAPLGHRQVEKERPHSPYGGAHKPKLVSVIMLGAKSLTGVLVT